MAGTHGGTSFDFKSQAERSQWAENQTHKILKRGWRGATDVIFVPGLYRRYDHIAYLPEWGRDVWIDTKAVNASYTSIFWETRHEGINSLAWGQDEAVDMLFWYMNPRPTYVIDLTKARPIVAVQGYAEQRLDRPSRHNGSTWWTWGHPVPLADLADAIVEQFEIADEPSLL